MAAPSPGTDNRDGRLLEARLNVLVAGICDPNRLGRGRTYARQGAVDDIDVEVGRLRGSVQGSRPQPYEVIVDVTVASDAEPAMALIPERPDVRFTCSCPDWDDPCKHAVAVMFEFSAMVADDTSLLRKWRGATREASTERAVVGSRTAPRAPSPPGGEPAPPLDPAATLALGAFLGRPASFAAEPISRLGPPNAAWGELWAEMLTAALETLSDGSD